jgi:hypothetical protein
MDFKKLVFVAVLLLILVTSVYAAEQKVYRVTLEYDDGEVSFDNVILTLGAFNEPFTSSGDYRIDLVSFDNEALYSEKFDFNLEVAAIAPPEWFDEEGNQIYIPGEDEQPQDLTKTTKEILIPYFSNGKQINVYHQTELILEESVVHFSDLCGDGICQDSESYESCQVDCVSGGADDYCDEVDEGICDPDCSVSEDVDCVVEQITIQDSGLETSGGVELVKDTGETPSKQQNIKLIMVLLTLGGVILAGIFIFINMRKKKTYMP